MAARAWICAFASALALGGCRREEDGATRALAPELLAQPAAASANGERAATERPDVPRDAPHVIFLGDSISAGLHLEPDQAFPAVLQRELAAEGHPFRLVNAGVSGDTSAGGLRRLDWLLKQAPDVLVLELGGNDGLRGQPVKEIEARLREIVTRATAAGARVLLLGVVLPPNLGTDYVRSFAELYAHLAAELHCAYVPFFMQGAAGDPALMQDDGIHPNARGHERLAANVVPALGELLETLQRSAK
jgi:acyl-CoA thioesterase-1